MFEVAAHGGMAMLAKTLKMASVLCLGALFLPGCPTSSETEFTESEPNNSLATAQSLPVPATVTGSQINNDEYSTITATYCAGTCVSINVSCHDFYKFTVTTFGRYTIALDFDDDAYDMGLYLFQPQGDGSYKMLHYAETHVSGMDGDLDVGDTLVDGTYYIGVSSFEMTTDVPYQLRLFIAVAYE
jgi:hypothetical protein